MCYCCVRQQRPQRATRPDTRLPYTTLFRAKGVKKAVANVEGPLARVVTGLDAQEQAVVDQAMIDADGTANKSKLGANAILAVSLRSEEHTSELQSLMRISYAVFCLKKKQNHHQSKNNE